MKAKGKRVAISFAAGVVMVLAAAVWIYRGHVRFYWLFEPLGRLEQGFLEYRHRQTGIVFVYVPGSSRRVETAAPFLISKHETSGFLNRPLSETASETMEDPEWRKPRELLSQSKLRIRRKRASVNEIFSVLRASIGIDLIIDSSMNTGSMMATAQFDDITAGDAVQAVLEQLELVCVVDNGVMVITAPDSTRHEHSLERRRSFCRKTGLQLPTESELERAKSYLCPDSERPINAEEGRRHPRLLWGFRPVFRLPF